MSKAANFSQQFYGPVAGALARETNSLIWGLQNVSFDLVSKHALYERGQASGTGWEGLKSQLL